MKNYYFGGYPSALNDGIYVCDESMEKAQSLIQATNTTYFDCKDVIVTILKEKNQGGIGVYDYQGTCLDQVLVDMKPGCYIEKKDDLIYVTHYHEGKCLIYEWTDHLTLKKELDFGSDAKCHQVIFDPQTNECGVVCLGLDKIIFFDANFMQTKEILFPKGSGPRHAVYNASGSQLYILSELSNELFVYDRESESLIQTISLLETNKTGSGAAIRLSQDGQHLYTSVRYADMITHLIWDDQQWKPVQTYACKKTPRDFILTDNHCIVAYQDEPIVEKIRLDEDLNLREIVARLPLEKMVCVKAR